MANLVGMCPNCNHIENIRRKALFQDCTECGATFAVRDAMSYLSDMCAEPKYVSKVIEMALEMEEDADVERALALMAELKKHHEHNEQVVFTYVRLSGYEPNAVREYLEMFAGFKGEKPFAEELLDNVMDNRYLMLLPWLVKFAENKLPTKKKRKYLDILENMRNDYTAGLKTNADGMNWLYVFYILSTVINVACFIVFFATSTKLWMNILILMGVFCAEFFLMFLHNRVFGNRLTITQTERVFMVAFLCSIPFSIGGALIGVMF